MTDRKQEAIAAIEKILLHASVTSTAKEDATEIYARLAPLREFPEEEIKNCLRDLAYDLKNDKVAFGPRLGGEPAISYYSNKLQRLWQGQANDRRKGQRRVRLSGQREYDGSTFVAKQTRGVKPAFDRRIGEERRNRHQ